MTKPNSTPEGARFDQVLLSVLANRFDTIIREMTNTLMRSGRSAILNTARDFSCAITTADNRLVAAVDGLPVHVFGCHLQTASMVRLHPDLRDGDAFLHNDPYLGNTHSADHTILVPVMIDGGHYFTCSAKAHQADCGNSLPTTYMPFAKDLYAEGALTFPCVRIQSGYQDIDDIVRMCRRRIRVPDQWYGDYLATLGAARIGERRLKELAERYGLDTIMAYVDEWFAYSERRMRKAISDLPAGHIKRSKMHDAIPIAPEGITINVDITVDPAAGHVEVDLTDNPDCLEAGLNLSEATATSAAMMGVLYCVDPTIPHNAGSFRAVTIKLRENCAVGVPRFPASCSVATTNLMNTVVNAIQSGFAQLGVGWGLAEGGNSMGLGYAVISGKDSRRDGQPYVTQLIMGENGGPASPEADGWVTYGVPGVSGVMYRDSVEINEEKYPIHIDSFRLITDSGGAGRFRGGLAARIVFGPKSDAMLVMYSGDGELSPARGVHGGRDGQRPHAGKRGGDGVEISLPLIGGIELQPGEYVVGSECGGGGYGDPLDRETSRVLHDVSEGWVSQQEARSVYGVVLSGAADGESLVYHAAATKRQRLELRLRDTAQSD